MENMCFSAGSRRGIVSCLCVFLSETFAMPEDPTSADLIETLHILARRADTAYVIVAGTALEDMLEMALMAGMRDLSNTFYTQIFKGYLRAWPRPQGVYRTRSRCGRVGRRCAFRRNGARPYRLRNMAARFPQARSAGSPLRWRIRQRLAVPCPQSGAAARAAGTACKPETGWRTVQLEPARQ